MNLSPCCCAALVYMISLDAYCCRKCGKEYSVTSTEKDHVLYDGGPPREINRGIDGHSDIQEQ